MQITDEAVKAAAEAIKSGRPFRHTETARAALTAALPHLSQGVSTAADIRLKIALWSDDEGLELSMRQGDELARSIMSALASHEPAPTDTQEGGRGWLCYNAGPGSMFWNPTREDCEHELSEDIRPATALEKVLFQRLGKPYSNGMFELSPTDTQEVDRLRRKLFKAEDRYEAEHRSHVRTGEARDKWRERAEAAEARVHELEQMVNEEEANHQDTGLRLRNAESRVAELVKALADLIDHVDRNTCVHESRHRGGTIWTICDDCGKKWADDRGGFIPHVDPEPVARARAVCGRSEIQKETDHD